MSFIHSALLSESILRSPAIGNSISPAPQFLRLSRWQSHGQKSSTPEGMAQSAPWLALQSHMTQVLQRRKVVDDGGFNALAPKSPPSETNKFSARKAPKSQAVNKSALLLNCCLLRSILCHLLFPAIAWLEAGNLLWSALKDGFERLSPFCATTLHGTGIVNFLLVCLGTKRKPHGFAVRLYNAHLDAQGLRAIVLADFGRQTFDLDTVELRLRNP